MTGSASKSAQDKNQHQFLFQPVGKYATDVHYLNVRVPFHFRPILDAITDMSSYLDKVNNITFGKATYTIVGEVTRYGKMQMNLMATNFKNLIANLPSHGVSKHQKRQILELFGLAGTAFGIANTIAIANLNDQLSKEIHRTDMLVDVVQLHENHLHNIDTQLKNVAQVQTEMIIYNPTLVQSAVTTMMDQFHDIHYKCTQLIAAAQMHRLTPVMLANDVLIAIKKHIDATADKHGYLTFISHLSDLFQIEVSFLYDPTALAFFLILHVPLVKPDYMLSLHQYLPFPLSQDFATNHSLTPSVGEKDILAFGFMNTFKILSQSDLTGCHKMGETYFCKGRNVLETQMDKSCLGSLFMKQLAGMKKFCKFEIKPLTEQVFQLSRNKWQVYSQIPFTTTIVCEKEISPLSVEYSTFIELKPGCKVRLQSHVIYSEKEDSITTPGIHFTWSWNVSALFPEMTSVTFSKALTDLNDFGLHVVEAADIAHQLKFASFNDNAPLSITNLFSNPFNYIIVFIVVASLMCTIYVAKRKCSKRTTDRPPSYELANMCPLVPANAPIFNLPPTIFSH